MHHLLVAALNDNRLVSLLLLLIFVGRAVIGLWHCRVGRDVRIVVVILESSGRPGTAFEGQGSASVEQDASNI